MLCISGQTCALPPPSPTAPCSPPDASSSTGDFQQTGHKFSFASSGSFTVAFLGEGPHSVDIESAPHSGFANIDPRYGSYTLADSRLEIFGKGAYSIFVGVIEGLIELSQIEEMSETTLLVCGGIGITLTVGAVAAPQFVLPAMAVGGLATSIGPAWEAIQGIGDTAEGNSFAYEKAREYGRNFAKLIVSICDIADSIDILKDPALLRDLAAKLLDSPAASLLNDLSFLRRAAIGNLDDALKLLKEKVSPEALKALAAALKEYGKKQLRRVVEAVEKVYDNTKEVLTKECVPKLLKEIRECEDSLNDAVERVVRWIRKGEGYTYKGVNIHGRIDTEIDEVDLVNKIIYEDKSASRLYMENADFPQTEQQWAFKHIYKKGSNRIEAINQSDYTLSIVNTEDVPDINSLKSIRDYVFRIDADTPALRLAVEKSLNQLSAKYPEYNFSVIYGGK